MIHHMNFGETVYPITSFQLARERERPCFSALDFSYLAILPLEYEPSFWWTESLHSYLRNFGISIDFCDWIVGVVESMELALNFLKLEYCLDFLFLLYMFLSVCWLDFLRPASGEIESTTPYGSRLISMEPQASKKWKQIFHFQLLHEQIWGRLFVALALLIWSSLDQSLWLTVGGYYHGLPAHT